MKKFLLFAIIIPAVLGFSAITWAAPNIGGMAEDIAGRAGYDTGGVTETTISKTVGGIIRGVLGMVGVLFLALTVYAGFLWMTASGNDEQIGKAKKMIISAFIGIVIVAAAYGITALVMTYIFNAAAPEGRFTGGNESIVERKMGCCVLREGNPPPCWNFATIDQCTGDWYSDTACNTMGDQEGINCIPQN